jgi:outer membrane protein OmpA-like peptidoglycan-associated protein
MKNLNRLILIMLAVVVFENANAQDKNNPWNITVGINAVDFYPIGDDAPHGELFSDYFNVEDHWNILSSISNISLQRYFGGNFSVGAGFSINKIENWGELEDGTLVSVNDLMYYGIDTNLKYSFAELIDSKAIEPFLGLGLGYTWIQEGPYNSTTGSSNSNDLVGSGTVNGTFGLSFWFSDNVGLTLQSAYKHSAKDNLPSHFQHAAGLSIKFGGTDTDGDGVYDKYDDCPEVPGLEAFNGCPDSDADGIKDSEDTCPNEAGPAEYNGCPWPDTDGDQVLDKDDKCPNETGTVANNGCPEVIFPSDDELQSLAEYAKTINFALGKSDFSKEAYPTLQAITAILKAYPKANFVVEGHTDSTGTNANFNQLLSERRAEKVVAYFVENGVAADRLTAIGYGENQNIASNMTEAGRIANRRVEIKLVK